MYAYIHTALLVLLVVGGAGCDDLSPSSSSSYNTTACFMVVRNLRRGPADLRNGYEYGVPGRARRGGLHLKCRPLPRWRARAKTSLRTQAKYTACKQKVRTGKAADRDGHVIAAAAAKRSSATHKAPDCCCCCCLPRSALLPTRKRCRTRTAVRLLRCTCTRRRTASFVRLV